MKKAIITALALQALSFGAVAQETTIDATVNSFYAALKQGDVAKIRSIIDDPLYSQVEVLLTQNTEYPAFLRAHYLESTGAIQSATAVSTEEASVNFGVTYNDGSTSYLQFRLRSQPNGLWKIVEQELTD